MSNSGQVFRVRTGSGISLELPLSAYHQLLSATIDFLQQQKTRGQRHVAVNPTKLAALLETNRDTATLTGAENQHEPFEKLRASLAEPQATNAIPPGKRIAFCTGNENADLIFVVEDINRNDGNTKNPLQSKPGQLLSKIVNAMNLSSDNIYIINILKPQSRQSTERNSNQIPSSKGEASFSQWLQEKIMSSRPKIIVALGKAAIEILLDQQVVLTRFRGKWQAYHDIPLMPTFHPAYLLRNQSLTEKRKIWEDMLAVMEKTAMPISDKQRGFFLKRD